MPTTVRAFLALLASYLLRADPVVLIASASVYFSESYCAFPMCGVNLNLGLMYAHGDGVTRNYLRAYMWFDIAATPKGSNLTAKSILVFPKRFSDQASALTEQIRNSARHNRDVFAKQMYPAQVAEARKLARIWMLKYRGQ